MLTERGIASLIRAGQPGWNTDRNTHGVGSLVLRITNAGTPLWYFRPAIGQRKPFQFGQYRTDGDGETTFTSKQARERANDLEALVRTGVSDLKEYFEAQHAAAEQAKAAAEAAQRAVEEQARIEPNDSPSTASKLCSAPMPPCSRSRVRRPRHEKCEMSPRTG
jgi:hypothetical protein